MGVKDPFSYSGRWESVGLDCSNCNHFIQPAQWPDLRKESACRLHKVSLEIELGADGYKLWEWLCKDFSNHNALPKALKELESVREILRPHILYRAYGTGGELLEFNMNEFRSIE